MKAFRHLPRFRRARAELVVLEERERWPRDRIAAFQLGRLNAVWAHAVAHVPYYRDLREQAEIPDRFTDLAEFRSRVPALPSEIVRDRPSAFVSERAGSGIWERTSGSRGAPMLVYWGGEARRGILRCRYRLYASWGVDLFDPATYVMGPASWSRGAKGVVARMAWQVKSRLRDRQWIFAPRLGPDEVRSTLARIARFRPVMLYGYSRTIQLLAAEAEASGVRWKELRVAVLTSEPAPAALRRAVSRGFGVPTAVEYGATECGLIAGEGPDGVLRAREDVVLVETLPRPDGRHEIVLTVLVNPSFPLVRYRIGDLTEGPLIEPAAGFVAMGAIQGRDDDFLVARGGGLVDSTAVEEVVHGLRGVRAFRARQGRDGTVTLLVELAPDARPIDPSRMVRPLRELLEGYPVVVETVSAIAPTEAGKRRVVTSELARASDPSAVLLRSDAKRVRLG